jgi:hypothetical protein
MLSFMFEAIPGDPFPQWFAIKPGILLRVD